MTYRTPPPLFPVDPPVARHDAAPATPATRHTITVALRWVRYRVWELATVATLLALAATVTLWFAAPVAPIVAVWVWHEIQLTRKLPRHE